MKKLLSAVLLVVMLFTFAAEALAERMYILPDSDKRKLTWDEVAEWDYESLGYAFNEIFARHGYDFIPGREYHYYFNTRPWYKPNGTGRYSDYQPDCYPYVTSVEWYNYELIKEVRAAKKYNDWGRNIWDSFSTGFDTLQGFEYLELKSGQVINVYSAPSTSSWRGANGKAQVSTNGAVWAAGWESGWLLIMYETNNGSVRVGYINSANIRGGVPMSTQLNFAYDRAKTTARCTLTDDPARTGTAIATLNAGTQVTWLTRFYNRYAWDYVEVRVGGKTTRGFIRAGSLDINRSDDPLEGIR